MMIVYAWRGAGRENVHVIISKLLFSEMITIENTPTRNKDTSKDITFQKFLGDTGKNIVSSLYIDHINN